VQYQETDFAFVSRLMEHEGIYYYFKHEKNQHTLVLADDMGAHETLPDYPRIGYLATDRVADGPRGDRPVGGDRGDPPRHLCGGRLRLQEAQGRPAQHPQPAARQRSRPYEMYEWLGGYSDAGQGEHYARIRLEEAQAQAERDTGHATVRGMAPGYRFTMQNAPRDEDNREYLIVSVTYNLREGGYATARERASTASTSACSPRRFRSARRASRGCRPPTARRPPRWSGPRAKTSGSTSTAA
jgi:type VI secretion system secreted protein VgrG